MTSPNNELTLAPTQIIQAYVKGIDALTGAVAGMTVDQLRARPSAGRWSSLEVVCHIADCEQFFADRMKRTIAMERPLLMGADGSIYPEPLSYQQREIQEELDLVAATRRQLARCLRLLPANAWQRTAVHSEAGLVTLLQLLEHAVDHLNDHLVYISEKRTAMKC